MKHFRKAEIKTKSVQVPSRMLILPTAHTVEPRYNGQSWGHFKVVVLMRHCNIKKQYSWFWEKLPLRIDTGDTAWYVVVAIKRLPLNNCSRYVVMLKRI